MDILIDAGTACLKGRPSGTGMPPGSGEVKPYAGRFPPSGAHDYEFTLYALKTDRVDVPEKISFRRFYRVFFDSFRLTGASDEASCRNTWGDVGLDAGQYVLVSVDREAGHPWPRRSLTTLTGTQQ